MLINSSPSLEYHSEVIGNWFPKLVCEEVEDEKDDELDKRK